MKMRISRLKGKTGSVLLASMLAMVLVGTILTGYLARVVTEQRLTSRSLLWNASMPIIDAGIEEALAHLNRNVLTNELNPSGVSNPTADGWQQIEANVYEMSRTAESWSNALTNDHYTVRINLSRRWQPEIYAVAYMRVPLAGPTFAAIGWTDFPQRQGFVARKVKAVTSLDPVLPKGLVAKGQIDLRGNNITVDSFDSRYATTSTNGRYDPAKARDGGDVATNGALTNSLSVGNALIRGHVSTGPGGNVYLGPNGGVGTRDWISKNKGVQPGFFADDMNVDFADAEAPSFAPYLVSVPGSITGTNGVAVQYDRIVPSGTWRISQLTGKTYIQGNVTLVVTSTLQITGTDCITLATNASLKMYVAAASAALGGNGVVNETGLAKNFSYYGLPSNTSISLQGNAAFTGTIYAPDANMTFGGGGNNTVDFVGACVTKTATLNGHYNFHFDEALKEVGPTRAYVVDFWREQ